MEMENKLFIHSFLVRLKSIYHTPKSNIVTRMICNCFFFNIKLFFHVCSRLLDAAGEGDDVEIQHLLQTAPPTLILNEALQLAVEKGHASSVSLLLSHGASVNVSDLSGNTLLMMAVELGHNDITKLLLNDPSCNVNVSGSYNLTALHRATWHNDLDVVQTLLQVGALIDLQDKAGDTALLIAIRGTTNTEITKSIISAGFDVNIKNGADETPLIVAAEKGEAEIVQILTEAGANLNLYQAGSGTTALMCAASENHIKVADLLLTAGANPLIVNHDGFLALHIAISQGHPEMARFLIDRMDRVLANKDCWSDRRKIIGVALSMAIKEQNPECVRLTLEAGADTEKCDDNLTSGFGENHDPALIKACQLTNPEVVQILLDHGCDPNVPWGTQTPLWVAKHPNIIRVLIQNGAQINHPMHARLRYVPGLLHKLCRDGLKDCVKVLLDANKDPNGDPPSGDPLHFTTVTPLLLAISENYLDVVNLLLQNGANHSLPVELNRWMAHIYDQVSPTGPTLVTPLELAVHKRSINIIRSLIFSNCDLQLLGLSLKLNCPPANIADNKNLVKWLTEESQTVKNLQVQTRTCILRSLANMKSTNEINNSKYWWMKEDIESDLCKMVGQLPLPEALRMYVLLPYELGRDDTILPVWAQEVTLLGANIF